MRHHRQQVSHRVRDGDAVLVSLPRRFNMFSAISFPSKISYERRKHNEKRDRRAVPEKTRWLARSTNRMREKIAIYRTQPRHAHHKGTVIPAETSAGDLARSAAQIIGVESRNENRAADARSIPRAKCSGNRDTGTRDARYNGKT